jgi:tetratricopeptide (TPR) repeat protein
MLIAQVTLMTWLSLAAGCASTESAPALSALPRSVTIASLAQAQPVQPTDDKAHLPLEAVVADDGGPATPSGLPDLPDRARRQLERARTLVEQGRLTEAIIELERGLRYAPDHWVLQRELAWLHRQTGSVDRAGREAEAALATNPNDMRTWLVRGWAAREEGRPEDALEHLSQAVRCADEQDAAGAGAESPNVRANTWHLLAEVLTDLGYGQAAVEAYARFEEVLANDPAMAERAPLVEKRREAAWSSADLLEGLDRPAEAAAVLRPWVEGEPDSVAWTLRYARLLLQAEAFDDALRAVQRLRSDDDRVFDLLREIHAAAGHPEQMVNELRGRMSLEPERSTWVLRLAEVLTELDRAVEARTELEAFLRRVPEAKGVRQQLLSILVAGEKWRSALAVATEGLELQPEAHDLWASAFLSNLPREAAEQLLASATAAPRSADSMATAYWLGQLAMRAGRYDDAIQWLGEAWEGGEDFLPAKIALARAFLYACQWQGAEGMADELAHAAGPILGLNDGAAEGGMADAGRAVDQAEAIRIALVIAEIRSNLDDYSRAALVYQKVLEIEPGQVEAGLALARIHKRLGQTALAQQRLRALLEIHPDEAAAYELLANIYLQSNDRTEAVRVLEKLLVEAPDSAEASRARAFFGLMRTGDPAVFRVTLNRLLEERGPDPLTFIALGDSFGLDDGRPAAALLADTEQGRPYFEQALEADPRNEEALLRLVQLDRDLLNYAAAAARLREAVDCHPHRHAWWRLLIQIYGYDHQYDQAIAAADEQLAREGLDVEERDRYRALRFEMLWRAKRRDEAIRQLEQWAALEEAPGRWTAGLARALADSDQPVRALPLFEALHEGARDSNRYLNELIQALVAAGRIDRAAQYALDWLYDDPDNVQAWGQLAAIQFDAGAIDAALEMIPQEAYRPERRTQYERLAIAGLADAGRHAEAARRLEQLIQRELKRMRDGQAASSIWRTGAPTEEDLQQWSLELARELLLAGEHEAAEEVFVGLVRQLQGTPAVTVALQNLALCYQYQGRVDDALRVQEQVLQVDSTDVGLNNDVAYGWAERHKRLPEAARMARYAVSQNPYQAAYLDTLGWVEYKQGNWDSALRWLTRAAHLVEPPDPVIYDHLGDVWWRVRNREEAIASWRRAAELARQEVEAEEADALSEEVRRIAADAPGKIEAAERGAQVPIAPTAAEAVSQDAIDGAPRGSDANSMDG